MQIQTLIKDIYSTVENGNGEARCWFTTDLASELSKGVTDRLQLQFGRDEVERRLPRIPVDRTLDNPVLAGLRLSKMGPRCPKALWNSVHHPELREALPAWATIKFSFGHILESLAIVLAKAAGHHVTGEQSHVSVDGISGHRDCVIDGCVVDVKSASSRSFLKFKDKSIAQNDPFGYLEQLDGYLVGSYEDPLVTVKDRGYLLAIDKTLGHMTLYEHYIREAHIRERIRYSKEIVALSRPPSCACETVPFGKSGNIALGVRASYSDYKFECFPHLRTFLYSDGPKYLSKVVKRPDVTEIDRHGNLVYN